MSTGLLLSTQQYGGNPWFSVQSVLSYLSSEFHACLIWMSFETGGMSMSISSLGGIRCSMTSSLAPLPPPELPVPALLEASRLACLKRPAIKQSIREGSTTEKKLRFSSTRSPVPIGSSKDSRNRLKNSRSNIFFISWFTHRVTSLIDVGGV